MKNLVVAFFLLSISYSYSQHEISGTVSDQNSEIGFANVILTDSAGQIVIGTITDGSGKFSFSIKKGTYNLNISYLGYKNLSQELVVDSDYDLGTVKLIKDKTQLAEIIIKAEKPLIERKVDRFVVNIENAGFTATRKTSELLSLAPGVFVTSQGSISINGSSGTGVMVNGRLLALSGQDLMNYINMIDPDTIKNIEVIVNPSAKYDASGTGGLLNIVLKKNSSNGWKGSIKAGYRQGEFGKINSGANLSYGTNEVVIYGGLNYDQGKSTREIVQRRFFDNETVFFDQESNETFDFTNFNSKIGVDYTISKGHFLSIEAAMANNGQDTPQKNALKIFNDKQLDSVLLGDFFQDKSFQSFSSSVHYNWEIDTLDRKLEVKGTHLIVDTGVNDNYDTDYFNSNNELTRNQRFRSDVPIAITISTLQTDFEYPFRKKHNVYIGSKLSFIETNNDNKFEIFQQTEFVNDASRTNTFGYDETILAGYLDYATSFGKTNFEMGIRAEYSETAGISQTTDQRFTNSYLDWFPSLFITRPFGKSQNHSLSLSYSRRIERPYYSDLNPFQYFIDTFSSTVGNPDLQPQYTDGIEVSTTIKNKYNVSLFYRMTDAVFTQITRQDDATNQTIFIRENYDQLDNYGLSLTVPIKIAKWWNVHNNLVYAEKNYKIADFQNSRGFWMYGMYTKVTLSENLSFDLQSYFQTKSVQGVFNIEPIFNTDFSVSASFFKKKMECSLAITDIFRTYKEVSKITFENQNSFVSQKFDTRRLAIQLKYNFSSGQKHTERKKQSTNKAEKRRIIRN